MAESIVINGTTKAERYTQLIPQIKSLIATENDLIANLSNIAAALNEAFRFLWVGFYLVKDNELVLGPFQGPVACTRIAFGRGVCGNAWKNKQTLIVPDVDAFPGHIACSSLSKSEIVVPVFNDKKEVVLILDVDSETLSHFDETDAFYLEQIVALINK